MSTSENQDGSHSNDTVEIAKSVKISDLCSDDIIILVMGPSGSGKSTFINKACDSKICAAGESLEPCTKDITITRLFKPELSNSDICFVEIPSRDEDHIYQSYQETLSIFDNASRMKITVSGLLYFHKMSDSGVSHSWKKRIVAFQNLFAGDLKKAVLITTMWEQSGISEGEHDRHQQDLEWAAWKAAINEGSNISRFSETAPSKSALEIVKPLIQSANKEFHDEMSDLILSLSQSSAESAPAYEVEYLVALKKILRLNYEQFAIFVKATLTGSGFYFATYAVQMKDFSPRDHIILLLGLSGSGKSKFVRDCTGVDPGVNENLSGHTKHLISVATKVIRKRKIIFVDTPGFGQGEKGMSNTAIVREINGWLKELTKRGLRPSRVLYFHHLSAPLTERSFLLSKGYCTLVPGHKAMIATTTPSSEWLNAEPGISYEAQTLKVWGGLKNSRAARYCLSDPVSARTLIRSLMDKET